MNGKIFTLALCALFFNCAKLTFASETKIPDPKLFAEGEKSICFVGDSITHHGYYPKHIALYYITRYPNLKKVFLNAGYEGGSANTTNIRVEADVASKNADIYTVMLGMNDVRHWNFTKKALADKQKHEEVKAKNFDIYKRDMTKLVDSLQKRGKVVLLSSSIYDGISDVVEPIAVARNGKIIPIKREKGLEFVNDELNRYGQWCAQLAKERGLRFADHWRETNAANIKIVKENPHNSAIGKNRVHPFDLGGLFTAYAFLKDIGETSLVSAVKIDAKKKYVDTKNARISHLKIKHNGAMSFTLKENALPFPFTKETKSCPKYCDFNKDLNVQSLAITSLPKYGIFALKIDGKSIGEFSAEQLASGMNLAELNNTPQADQARDVEKQIEIWRERTQRVRDLFGTEFIMRVFDQKYTPEQKAHIARAKIEQKKISQSTVESFEWYIENYKNKNTFQKQADLALEEAYKLAQPRSHKYELVPVKK